MTMDARTQRTLMRLLAVFLAAGAGDAIIQYLSDGRYDWRHLLAALGAAAIVSLEQFLKNTGDNAPPTVAAVNATLQTALDSPMVSVPPPKVAIPEPPVVVTLPDTGVPPAG